MEKKRKILICFLSILALLVSFGIGFFIGQKYKFFKYSKRNNISFYSVKKNEGKEMSAEEKKAIKLFIMSYEECLANNLDVQEKEQLIRIQNEVLKLAEGNKKIKFNIKNLENVKENDGIVKKVRRCQKNSYKHITKEDRRFIRSGLSKMSINNVIAMYHGIR